MTVMTPNMQEALNTPVNASGTGEDEAIRKFLQKPEGEPFGPEDVEIAQAIQKIFQGGKLTPQQERIGAIVKELFERRQANEEAFNADQDGFIQAQLEKGKSLLKPPEERAKIQAQVAQEFEQAKANVAAGKIQVIEQLRLEPQVQVIWPANPRPLMLRTQQGGSIAKMRPLEIRIGPVLFYYRIGQSIKVPRSVANRIEAMNNENAQNEARKAGFSAEGTLKETAQASKEWDDVNKSYGTNDPNPFKGGNNSSGQIWQPVD